METSNQPFTNRQLRDMIVPLFFEQLLVMLVGLALSLIHILDKIFFVITQATFSTIFFGMGAGQ